MSKIRVLSDHVINQIAAGEVVERPASVAKELVENSIDAGARRVEVEVEAGGRRLLRVADDGEGMTRDDAVLAFERHATSKIHATEDLEKISTLGFRGEALASIASVARVEMLTNREGEPEATRVIVEGGRMRDVGPAARPRGTTLTVRDLFFNVPARRKFLRSEATESFHLANLVTHYALAHPEIAFALTNNGREVLRADPAADLRERAYQIFGAEFLENLLEVNGGVSGVARVRGYVSAPRERRTTRDAQFLFVNGRFVRDRLVARALGEAYRSVLPHGTYPAALLFLEVPPEEVDVNVHPAKTEVRFRRSAAITDAVRDSVRAALARGGFLGAASDAAEPVEDLREASEESFRAYHSRTSNWPPPDEASGFGTGGSSKRFVGRSVEESEPIPRQESIEFGWTPPADEHAPRAHEASAESNFLSPSSSSDSAPGTVGRIARATSLEESNVGDEVPRIIEESRFAGLSESARVGLNEDDLHQDKLKDNARPGVYVVNEERGRAVSAALNEDVRSQSRGALPPLNSAAGFVRGVEAGSLSADIRPLGQLEESYIIATDPDGLLLIDQRAAHERILFDKYRALEASRSAESQTLLIPETFDLTPAQAAAFDQISADLELYGFGLMRLSGRTVAVRAVPADLPAGDARNLLAEILDTVDSERRGRARETLREQVAATLARRAAVKSNTPLTAEKIRWLIDRLLKTSSPTTCPQGRPIILRLTTRDLERGFQRP